MVKVVYFNQWFSSIADVISDLKRKYGDSIKFIASSKNKNHAYKDSVDVFLVEDWEEVPGNEAESMQNYINYIFDVVKTYKVDLFFAKKHADTIAKYKNQLAMLGVFTLLEDYKTLKSLDSKAGVYDKLKQYKELEKYIPAYMNPTDDESRNKMTVILNQYEVGLQRKEWCLKKDIDEGGASFRKIERKPFNISQLDHFGFGKVTIKDARQLLVDNETSSKIIFMELLDSPEISVDCYNSKRGFIHICRSKGSDRVQKLFYSDELADICKKIGEIYNLQFVYNVQFRYSKDGQLKLLEINPRLSGGTYYSVLFNLSIAEILMLDMLNMNDKYNIDRFKNFETKYVTHLEKAMEVRK